MATTLRLNGRLDAVPEKPTMAAALPGAFIQPKHSATLQSVRAGQEPVRLEGLAEDDAVELELQDGLRVWLRVGDLEGDFGLRPARDAADGSVEIPTVLRVGGGPSRGLVGDWAIKGLKVFGIDLPGGLAKFVSQHVEGRQQPGPGLHRCTPDGPAAMARVGTLSGTGPTLVFIHGTASSTEGSFGALWQGGAGAHIHALLQAYEGRVLAFQHRTLTESPVANALALASRLAELLPKGAPLHLVSHSRGGLVGELLARGLRVGAAPFDEGDFRAFPKEQDGDVTALRELNRVLTRSQLAVERFVRVACPARGTTLADRRLDRYFTVMTNLAGLVPFLRGSGVYDGLVSLTAGVLKERTDAARLPGLQAMMPESALVGLLNRPGAQTSADLHVLGGDLEGTGVLGRLKALATDFFYREDHDLVVNTPSMFGGTERTGPVRYWIDTGGEVTHFNYFRNADTAGRLMTALRAPATADFRTFEHKASDAVTGSDYRKRAALPQPTVVVLPGIMGTNLAVGARSVWMSLPALGLGGLQALRMGAQGVRPDSLVGSSYRKLLQHLSLTHRVVPFPYDWRLSIADAAEKLRAQLDGELEQARAEGQPVRIVAHSMGGLVVRAMLATAKGRATWEEMGAHPGARLLMLGTPNGGSHAIAALLMGRDSLARKLALLDVRHDHAQLTAIIAAFDGVLNLLPHGGDVDLYDLASWQRIRDLDVPPAARGLFSSGAASAKSSGIGWALPDGAQLAAAAKMRALLAATRFDPARTVYVAGVARETACAVVIDEKAPAGRRVAVLATARGDGRVPWATGIPAELADAGRVYYMNAVHGDLASTEEAFPALTDLLATGATTKLSRTAPVARSADVLFPLRSPEPDMLPDADEILASATGGSRRRAVVAEVRTTRVRVVHGNLSRATSPVLVGHYSLSEIVSAEAYLDAQLEGRLRELHRMDLYPGPLDTGVVVQNEPGGGAHPGAIIVGLGRFGGLSPGDLTSTLTNGLTMYGAERVAWARRRRQRGEPSGGNVVPAPATVLLIGSGEGGVTLADSLLAILRAVRQANERLTPPSLSGDAPQPKDHLSAFIDRVDILELYEDRAILAAHTLNRLAEAAVVRRSFVVDEHLAVGDEGLTRATFEDTAGWSHHIWIKTTADGSLHFDAVTQRAAAASYVGHQQKKNAERFLDRAVATTSRDNELGLLLFEMLVPPPFKEAAPERRPLTLLLDPGAAGLPWELLQDRYDEGGRPLAVETGMIRQLLVPGGAERRREAAGRTALVVGNPPTGDPRFVDLPGAADEAGAVAAQLGQGGYDVTSLVGAAADPRSVIASVFEPWQILHLAGHGVYRFVPRKGAEPVSGLVLDNGIFLTSELLDQLRVVPELVFINCCHLGAMSGPGRRSTRFHRLAANLATRFIRLGARAVVAAGWAVDDGAASAFAVEFYRQMLAGTSFADAVRSARERVYEEFPAVNTWGAYQCYGDAAFTLGRGRRSVPDRRYVSPTELTIFATNLAEQAATATPERRVQLLADLEDTVRKVRDEWLADACVAAAVARAYGELGEFEKAIERYRHCAVAENARGSLRAMEQWANLLGRWAARGGAKDAARSFGQAKEILAGLKAVGDTAERASLAGSLHKRIARAATSRKERVAALKEMTRAYESARRKRGANAWYPLANRLTGQVVLSWAGRQVADAKPADIKAGLAELAALASQLAPSATRFWELALAADRLLLEALWKGGKALGDETRAAIVSAYATAVVRGGSPREIGSVTDQIEFLKSMAAGLRPTNAAALTKWLTALQADLDRLGG
jgi:CHAT domain-containing protein/triacylglycerol esterase/lipase EstA (alpha/beta hydrolase family)